MSSSTKPDPETDPLEVLLFETSPYGNIDAIVQTDQRSIYFYLYPKTENLDFVPKACWIRNLIQAPYIIDQDDYLAGRQVLLPRTHLKTNSPGRRPLADELKIVWFEEGTGAALIEHNPNSDPTQSDSNEGPASGRTIGVIPPWSGHKGFHGFAADCAMDSPICWPLPQNPRLQERIDRAAEFWTSFLAPPDPFVTLQEQLQPIYDKMFLTDSQASRATKKYYRIDGGSFPPRGLLEYVHPEGTVLVTSGMSLCPQPNVELASAEPEQLARIELAIFLGSDQSADSVINARNGLAQLASYPWRYLRWLGSGHTCQFPDVFHQIDKVRLVPTTELRPGSGTSWLNQLAGEQLTSESTDKVTASRLIEYRNNPVHLLWLVPENQ